MARRRPPHSPPSLCRPEPPTQSPIVKDHVCASEGGLPYFPEAALSALNGAHVVLAGAMSPVTYIGYPGIDSRLVDEGRTFVLCDPGEDTVLALQALADQIDAPPFRLDRRSAGLSGVPCGALAYHGGRAHRCAWFARAGRSLCRRRHLRFPFFAASADALPHTILGNTGGAIGQGLPCALGAAIAAPERRVVALQSDGSAHYTVQTLWTMARERASVTVLIAANHRYAILENELARAGVAPVPAAEGLTRLDRPVVDWVRLAEGYGVAAERALPCENLHGPEARTARGRPLSDRDGAVARMHCFRLHWAMWCGSSCPVRSTALRSCLPGVRPGARKPARRRAR